MFKKLSFTGNSILISWILSYLALLSLTLGCIGITYFETKKVVEDEILGTSDLIVNQLQQSMDNIIKDLKNTEMELSYNSSVQELMNIKQITDDGYRFTIFQLAKNMKLYQMSNKWIKDCYIYFKNIDMVVTPLNSLDSKTFYKMNDPNHVYTFEGWKQLMTENTKGVFLDSLSLNPTETNQKSLIYIKSLSTNQLIDPLNAIIVITIDESKLFESDRNLRYLDSGNILIIDNENNIKFSTNQAQNYKELDYKKLSKEQGILSQTLNKKSVVISYTTSKLVPFKYLAVIPSDVFWSKSKYIGMVTLISIILCIVIGMFMSYYLSRKRYGPIHKIIGQLEKNFGIYFDKNSNEFNFIRQSIFTIFNEKENIHHKLEQQTDLLNTNFLESLIKGHSDSNIPIQDLLKIFKIQFYSDDFAIMLFHVKDVENLFQDDNSLKTHERQKLCNLILSNIIKELVGQNHQGYMLEMDGKMVCLVNFSQNADENGYDELIRIAEEAQEFIAEHFIIHVATCISNIHQTTTGIPQAYQEALQTMEYKMIFGIDDILKFNDIKRVSNNHYFYPLEKEQQFINNIKAGNYENAQQILDQVFNHNLMENQISLPLTKCLMFDIISTMIKTMDEITNLSNDIIFKDTNPIEQLLECKTVNEMQTKISDILKRVCQYMGENNNNQLKDKIINYVKNHYQNPNLSVSLIADHLNLHTVYVSAAFKEQTGEGLLEHIQNIRIEKAKHLLETTNMSVNDTSDAVGFTNIRTFSRVFKKILGVTPATYREFSSKNL